MSPKSLHSRKEQGGGGRWAQRDGKEEEEGKRRGGPSASTHTLVILSLLPAPRAGPGPQSQPLPSSPLSLTGPQKTQAGSTEQIEEQPDHLLWVKIKQNQIFRGKKKTKEISWGLRVQGGRRP